MLSRSAVSSFLFLMLSTATATAGPNAGGTLVIHALAVEQSGGVGFCGVETLTDCESANVTLDNSSKLRTLGIYAVFSAENEPDLRGVEFGLSYGPGIHIDDFGTCSDFESTQGGWPQSGTGTRIVWDEGQTERIVPVYWLVGYSYAEDSGTLAVTPHPETGGHFADGTVIPILDQITGYGVLGFGTPGHVPCPTPGYYYVTADGEGEFPTIQSAIDIAGPGSLIELEDGIYRGDGNRDLNLNDTAIVLRSRLGNPEACVIDCEGTEDQNRRGLVVATAHDADARVEGIKFINGYAGERFGFQRGGGGIALQQGARLTIVNCVIENCFSEFAGGGVGSAGRLLEMSGCVIRNNSTGGLSGGGMSADGGLIRIENCVFEGNGFNAWGGGLRFTNCEVEMTDSQIVGNRATDGGGLVLSNSEAVLTGCTWSQNVASRGGALFCIGGTTRLNQCTLSDNTGFLGSGIYTDADTKLEVHNSVISFGREGEAILCGANVKVLGSDFYGNADGDWVTCIEGQLGVDGNISADPLFCDATSLDYTLDRDSPCAPRTWDESSRMGAWPVSCGAESSQVPSVEVGPAHLGGGAKILRVLPNPFVRATEIRYTVPDLGIDAARPVILIFDARGRRVRLLSGPPVTAGIQSVVWDVRSDDGHRVPAGVFYARLEIAGLGSAVRLTVLP